MYFIPFKRQVIGFLAFFAGISATVATDAVYINSGSVSNQIVDAYTFINEGYFQTTTSLPYETVNTLNYTNRGTIEGSVGFRFHTVTSNGVRKRASSFHNEGSIEAPDNGFIIINSGGGISTDFGSFLFVNATNVANEGSLLAGPTGLLRIDGNNVNLAGGALMASESATQTGFFTGFDNILSTNYVNDTKVTDSYWGVGTNNVLKGQGDPLDLTTSPFDPTSFNFGSGLHEVIDVDGFTNTVSVPSFFSSLQGQGFRPFVFATTNAAQTNRIYQVIFVSTNSSDPDLNVDVRFSSNGNATRGRQAIVQFSVSDTDSITGLPVNRYVYFSDNSFYATVATNLFYQTEFIEGTQRPNPYDIATTTPFQWTTASPVNSTFNNSLFTAGYSSSVVTNLYAGYSAYVGSATDPNETDPLLADPTNSFGRVEVAADVLNINDARIRSEGLLTLSAKNFIQVTNGARLDAQQLNLNLTSTNQTFLISNILAGTVKRIGGQLNAYSCIWSNHNIARDAFDHFHVLILENLMTSAQASTAYGFVARVTNQPNSSIIIKDDLTVARNFFVDSENVTIGGNLSLPGSIGYTNLPRVLNFTNSGAISIPSLTAFSRQNGPYLSFVNTNSIVAGGQAIYSSYFENSGILQATVGSIAITNSGGVANLTNGWMLSATDLRLIASSVQLSNSMVFAGSVGTNFSGQTVFTIGAINLSVGASLSDSGSNYLQSFNGVNLTKTSPGAWVGDLLDTKIASYSRPFALTRHTWAGLDVGATKEGFSNNAAVGVLSLDGYTSAKFKFSAPNNVSTAAIYVDYLELKNSATNYITALDVDSNFKIYFANANVTPSKLIQNPGLVWVKGYSGLNSSTNIVLLDGRTITVNRALVESDEIDSDGDGLYNRFDPYPFDSPTLSTSLINLPPLTSVLSWNGAANTTYTVDFTTNLVSWQVLTNVTTGSSAGSVTIQDPVSADYPRYYRVRYTP